MSHLSNVWFSVTGLHVASGDGCWVTTTDGDRYLDFAAGIAVNSTGHAHPAVVEAARAQLGRFTHACFAVTAYESYVELAERLNRLVK